MKNIPLAGAAVAVAALAGIGGWLWWSSRPVPAPVVAEAPAAAEALPAASAPAPAIAHPIEAASAAASSPAPAPTITGELTQLFGRKNVLSLFQLDDFVLRVVATVDNLGRRHASAKVWPMNVAAGRFTVVSDHGETVVGVANGGRYAAHLQLFESVDMKRVDALYRAFYPQFQQAYEELGYPHGYFNDRLVEVIDLLLATPEVDGPLRVHLPVSPGIAPPRPWVTYVFDDAALEDLSAGQKLLLRMGPANERRVKAKLRELRQLVATGAPTR